MDVIWNLTRVCPWDCAICCVSALHVCNTTKYYLHEYQKEDRKELTLAEKLAVLKILAEKDIDIDFSGGDPLYYNEDYQVIEQALRWIPSEKISISMTGSRITDVELSLLKKVGIVEFTLDNLPEINNPLRPRGYNLASMIAMKKCASAGIKARAVTVLYWHTMTEENLEKLYSWLCENKVEEWEFLRFYPSGRAIEYMSMLPSEAEYLQTMKFIKGFNGFTKVFFQHSLKILNGESKCSAGIESIGILPDGQVTVCSWALDKNCNSFKDFYIEQLPEDNFDEIMENVRKKSIFSKSANCCRTIRHIKKNNEKRQCYENSRNRV